MKKYTLFVLFLALSTVAFAQAKLSNYSRHFLESYAKQPVEQRASLAKKMSVNRANSVETIGAFVYFTNPESDKVAILEEFGATLSNDFDEFVTADIPVDEIEALSEDVRIMRIEVAKPVKLRMDKARVASTVDKVQAGTDLSHPFLGTGVVVGVVDFGFQYNHINFYDANNSSELRVKRVWNKEKYETQAAIEAAQYDEKGDEDGHATHVTGIAAGSFSQNGYQGVAPDAEIVMISLYDDKEVIDGVKYAFDYAQKMAKPAVVNLSLGSHIGPHDGTSTFDKALDQLVGPGRIVCGSAGNEGYYNLYIENTLQAGKSAVWEEDKKMSIEYYGNAIESGYIDIWGDVDQKYTAQLLVLDDKGNEVWADTEVNAMTVSMQKFSLGAVASTKKGTFESYSGKDLNGKGNITYYLGSSLALADETHRLAVRITAKDAGTVRAWSGDGSGLEWQNGTSSHTVGEIGGTANRIISVGAYATRKVDMFYDDNVNEIASFSSRGPTADGRIKPDILAPGCNIISSVPNTSAVRNASGFTALDKQTVNGTTYYWTYMTGTSMAAPFVTGVVATWLEANPDLTPEHIVDVFRNTAKKDSKTGSVPNNNAGWGKIDAYAGLKHVLATTDIKNLEHLPDAIAIYPNPCDGQFQLFFSRSDNNVTLNVYNLNGQQVESQRLGAVDTQQTADVRLNNVASGVYVVKVQGEATQTCLRLVVK